MVSSSLMTRRRLTGSSTVVLAIWLLLQSSSLYFLHHHPESASCGATALFCRVSPSHGAGNAEPAQPRVSTLGTENRNLPVKVAVCVLCYFNQNYHGFASDFIAPADPHGPSLGDLSLGGDFLLPADLLATTSPRAPPFGA